jgi:hypothetical protein
MLDKCSIEHYFLNPPLSPILLKEKFSFKCINQFKQKFGKFLELFVILLQIQQFFAKFLKKSPNFQYYKIENPKKTRIAIKENGTWTYTHYVNLIGAFIL